MKRPLYQAAFFLALNLDFHSRYRNVFNLNFYAMETKKHKSASIENLRFPITLTALLFTGSIVLASFTYTNGVERDQHLATADNGSKIDYMLEDVAKPEPPDVTPPEIEIQLPPDDNIKIDSNTQTTVTTTVVVVNPPDIKIGKDPITIVEPPIEWPDVEAMFDGGAAEMQRWINDHVNYPQDAIEMNEQGRVYLKFVVEKDGSISNIGIERGVSESLDREAKRLLRNMPKWIPGEAKGTKARTICRLPINFTLAN